jgi:hypothetical protein
MHYHVQREEIRRRKINIITYQGQLIEIMHNKTNEIMHNKTNVISSNLSFSVVRTCQKNKYNNLRFIKCDLQPIKLYLKNNYLDN